jgi:hypothetical protein
MSTVILNTVHAGRSIWGTYLRGFASAFDLRGRTDRNYFLFGTPGEADMTAIQNDWETVSDDLELAILQTTP